MTGQCGCGGGHSHKTLSSREEPSGEVPVRKAGEKKRCKGVREEPTGEVPVRKAREKKRCKGVTTRAMAGEMEDE